MQQLQHDGRDPAKVSRAEAALEDRAQLRDVDPGLEPGRIHLVLRRREDDVDPGRARELEIPLLVAGIVGEVGIVAELRRVHEQAHHEDVVLGAGRAQEGEVPFVQGAHRRHESDGAPRGRRERRAGLGDRADDVHAGTSAGSRPAIRAVVAARTR